MKYLVIVPYISKEATKILHDKYFASYSPGYGIVYTSDNSNPRPFSLYIVFESDPEYLTFLSLALGTEVIPFSKSTLSDRLTFSIESVLNWDL